MEFTRVIDNAIYSRKAFASARQAYSDYCTMWAVPKSDGSVAITVSVRPQYEQEEQRIVLEFWNYFLDSACQLRFETEPE
jgi:hypothetical protein